MTDLDEILREVRRTREDTTTGLASLGAKVDAYGEACQERNRAAHARIGEVKKDLDRDVRELRNRDGRRSIVAGAGSAGGLVVIAEFLKKVLGLNGGS